MLFLTSLPFPSPDDDYDYVSRLLLCLSLFFLTGSEEASFFNDRIQTIVLLFPSSRPSTLLCRYTRDLTSEMGIKRVKRLLERFLTSKKAIYES